MKRREFLKSTILFAAVSTVVGKAAGILSNPAFAAGKFVTAGKLGYKEVSPQKAKGKECITCKHYKANAAAGKGAGECVLPAMQNVMKSKPTFVKDGAYCNMWAKKA